MSKKRLKHLVSTNVDNSFDFINKYKDYIVDDIGISMREDWEGETVLEVTEEGFREIMADRKSSETPI